MNVQRLVVSLSPSERDVRGETVRGVARTLDLSIGEVRVSDLYWIAGDLDDEGLRTLAAAIVDPVTEIVDDPAPTMQDIEYLLAHAARYLDNAPRAAHIRSAFAGLRPLLSGSGSTASLRRDHRIVVSGSGLVGPVRGGS